MVYNDGRNGGWREERRGGGRSNDIYLFHFYNGTDEAIFAYVKCLEGDEGWNGSSIDLYIPSLSGRSDTLQIDGSLQYC